MRTLTIDVTGEKLEIELINLDRDTGNGLIHFKRIPPKRTLEREVAEERIALGYFTSQYAMEDWAAVVTALCRVLDRRLAELERKK